MDNNRMTTPQLNFYPELFECRSTVLEALTERGFALYFDYGSIDLLHDCYGLEICGIRRAKAAGEIKTLLRRLFPKWEYLWVYYEDENIGELGWKVMIHRDPERPVDDWGED